RVESLAQSPPQRADQVRWTDPGVGHECAQSLPGVQCSGHGVVFACSKLTANPLRKRFNSCGEISKPGMRNRSWREESVARIPQNKSNKAPEQLCFRCMQASLGQGATPSWRRCRR